MSGRSPWEREQDVGATEYFMVGFAVVLLVGVVVAFVVGLVVNPAGALLVAAVLGGIPLATVMLVYVGWFLMERIARR